MTLSKRDYSLTGVEGELARQKGLVEAEWYACHVPRQTMKQLMIRRNGPALRDTFIWFVMLIGSGYLLYLSWGSWWVIPALIAYAIIQNLPAVSRFHELMHGTPFKTAWLNETMYQITAFMSAIPATLYRWSHVRHHTDTIIVGRDREYFAERPPNGKGLLLYTLGYLGFINSFKGMIRHSIGYVNSDEKSFIPESAFRKLFWEARIWVLIYIGLIAWCFAAGTILPLMYVGLVPLVLGSPAWAALTITQHGGLSEDVLDHRLNTRTFYTNPVLQFLYTNMNYHLEHHMFPMVPYYNLPKLHEIIKSDCPRAYPSFWSAFVEGLKAVYRQRKEPTYTPVRPLPASARPFRYHPNNDLVS